MAWLGAKFVRTQRQVILGKPGHWRWVSGRIVDFDDWKAGEPSNRSHGSITYVSSVSLQKNFAEQKNTCIFWAWEE